MSKGKHFSDKVVWVTGASSGIGKELCIQLSGYGAQLILSSRNEEALHALCKELHSSDRHIVLSLDLAKSSTFDEKVTSLTNKVDRVDILIQNGGVSQRATAFDSSEDVIRRIMEVNFFGNILLTKSVLPILRKNKAQILVISSIAGKFGFFLRSSYSASKHALHGFYESLALEEEKNGISVTIACPGKINTPISQNALSADGKKHGEMDHNQETGMSVEDCVSQLLDALSKRKREVLIGNMEIKAVTLRRFLPSLFWKIIKNQSAT